jgi:hypothetical protein
MGKVMELKSAIDRLSSAERAQWLALVWPDSDAELSEKADTPPRVREKLAQAASGRFLPGKRSNDEVSDGGGHQAPELANRRRPPPFAPPKS